MNPIYEERIQPPRAYCFTPTNTHRKKSFTNSSLGYGTLKSRDITRYEEFVPKLCSTRNNSKVNFLSTPVQPRKSSSDDSIDQMPIAPPCSLDGEIDDDVFEESDDPSIPPQLELRSDKYHCQLCDAFYSRPEALEKHLECHRIQATPARIHPDPTRIHPTLAYKSQRKNYRCGTCGKVYHEKAKLNLHCMKRHPRKMEIIMVL